jgi:hypothetical protein
VYETAVKPKCPGCLLPFTPARLVGHAKECLKPRPRLLAAVLARFAPGGYVPLGAALVGHRRSPPRHRHTATKPGGTAAARLGAWREGGVGGVGGGVALPGHSTGEWPAVAVVRCGGAAACELSGENSSRGGGGGGGGSERGAAAVRRAVRQVSWNGSGDYRERPALQKDTRMGQLARQQQRKGCENEDEGASSDFWGFAAEAGKHSRTAFVE